MESYYQFPMHDISIADFPCDGFVLDLGGGGEGIIAKVKSEKTISIDPSKKELEETSQSNIKIVMDATNLLFLDNTFDVVTSFFTLMYIPADQRLKVFREAYRVLRPGGRFYIWDTEVRREDVPSEYDVFAMMLHVCLPDSTSVETGYGVPLQDHLQTLDGTLTLGKEAGFSPSNHAFIFDTGTCFFIQLAK